MKIRRTLPPAGAPIYLKDLFHGLLGMIQPQEAQRKLQEEIRTYFGVKHVFLVSSGKAALTLILQALHELSGKQEVIIPAYTCFSVPSAVAKAGLKPVICDIKETDFNYDERHLAELVGENTLCIVATHLFGIPCDIEPLLSLAESVGCYVVEDAAQAMGAKLAGKKAGSIGDAGFFSLGRGKNICAGSGGIIGTNNDRIADSLSERYASLKAAGLFDQLTSFCVAVFLHIFSRPSLYWFPAGLPFLKLGQTIYSTEFPVRRLAGFNAGLAANWRSKLEAFNEARREKAKSYKEALAGNGLIFFQEPLGSTAIYLRFPLIARNSQERDKLVELLAAAGLGASPNYPTGIAEIPELALSNRQKARCHTGGILAKQILTLPTHPQVEKFDIGSVKRLVTEQRCRMSLSFENP